MITVNPKSRLRRLSLKRGLDLTILSMGLFTIALILLTGEAYRRLAIDNQKQTLATVVAIESDMIMQTLSEKSRQLGLDIQHHPDVRNAILHNDGTEVHSLADEFKRFFVTTGILKLETLWVFDTAFRTVAFASRTGSPENSSARCDTLLHEASKRAGHERLRTLSRLCTYNGRTYYAQLLPIDLRPSGYVVVVSDPAHNLMELEKGLKLPISLYEQGEHLLYRSSSWSDVIHPRASLEAVYQLTATNGEPALDIQVQGNFLPFYESLVQLQRLIILLAIAATVATMIVARYVTRKIVLEPLHYISSQLRRTGTGRRISDLSDQNIIAVHEFAELQELYSALHDMALTDPLTQLPNRLHFERRLENMFESARANNETHALCYLDLDQFKIVNDSCGHAAGDLLLQQLAGVFREYIRSVDLFARIGGDEFALLLEHCSPSDSLRIANQLRKAVKDFQFFWRERCFSVGVSIGVVPIRANSGGTSRIMSLADASCYIAKQQGRNRVHMYSESDTQVDAYDSDIRWAARLQQALSEDSFQLFCQPVLGCARRQRHAEFLEILVWLRTDTNELIAPGQFLPAAERYNLVSIIDRWVFEKALSWLQENPCLDTCTCYSFNLSGYSLAEDDFLNFVIDRIDNSGINPELLAFEITESGAAINFTKTLKFISTLKGMGCRFILDDFGTGLSSFTYLQSLNVDYLKIDGHIVNQILRSDVDLHVLDAIVQIGHSLHITTIAECVESELIFRKLQSLGVDQAQGYYLQEPVRLGEYRHKIHNTPAISS